jgi:hypothetical protein
MLSPIYYESYNTMQAFVCQAGISGDHGRQVNMLRLGHPA